MVGAVAVEVGGALPHAHGGQVRRVQGGHVPLVHRVVGDPVQAHLPGAPRLRRRPLDALVQVLGLPAGKGVEQARRPARSPRVHPDAGVAVRHPLLRVDDLPVLVDVARPAGDVRVPLRHEPPLVGVPLLEGEPLRVGAVAQDHRVAPRALRPEHVGPQHHAVTGRHRHVALDHHGPAAGGAQAGLTPPLNARRRCFPPRSGPGATGTLPHVVGRTMLGFSDDKRSAPSQARTIAALNAGGNPRPGSGNRCSSLQAPRQR